MAIVASLTLWESQWAFLGTFCTVLLLLASCTSSTIVVMVSFVFASLYAADLLVKMYDEFFYQRKYLTDIHSKAVMVTGCDTGFGTLDSLRLADMGFLVYATVLGRDTDGARRLSRHQNVVVVTLDVTDQSNVDSVAQYVAEDLVKRKRTFWALINNAGIGSYADVEIAPVDHFADLMDINVFGVIRMCKAFVPLMRAAGGGRIVNMTSQASYMTVPATVPYSMTKHALMSLNDGLRLELKLWNITVHSISPGFYKTFPSFDDHVQRLLSLFLKLWETAPEEIKAATGIAYYKARVGVTKKFCEKTMAPEEKLYEVVDDVTHAVAGINPKVHYIPSTLTKVQHKLLGMLPQQLVDVLIAPPQPDVKPAAFANRTKNAEPNLS